MGLARALNFHQDAMEDVEHAPGFFPAAPRTSRAGSTAEEDILLGIEIHNEGDIIIGGLPDAAHP